MSEPRYSEAYPRLSVTEALKQWRAGRPHILWRDRLGYVIGVAEIIWESPETLRVRAHVQDLPYMNASSDDRRYSIVYKGSTESNARPYYNCDDCGGDHDLIIINEQGWSCKEFLRLKNRSSLLDEVIRITEDLIRLEGEIGEGRPIGMREAVYQQKQADYRAFQRRLGRRSRRSAGKDFLPRITSEWLGSGPYIDFVEDRLRDL